MNDAKGTRGHEHVVEIDAPIADVWRAITEAEEVTRWYVVEAEIDDHVGGTYRVSWGEGMDGMSDITAIEKERHFRVAHRPMPGAPEIATGPIVEEYFLERGDDGRTVLRLVTSGIPDTDDWDWFYEGTKRGWTIFMLSLRHYLERHPGTPREQFVEMVGLPGSRESAWTRMMGDEGLALGPDLEGAAAGSAISATTAFGEELEGEVLLIDPPYRLLSTVGGLNDGLLGVTIERMGPSNILYLSLSTFGLDGATVDDIRERWGAWLSGLFPQGEPPAEAFEAMITDPGATAGPDAG